MFEFMLAFLGILVGIILSHLCKEELESGNKYFKLWMILTLIILLIYILLTNQINYQLIIGLILGLFIVKEYLYFSLLFPGNFYTIFLIFIYGIPYGITLEAKKTIFYDIILFIIPIVILWYANYNLTMFGIGGLISILTKKALNLFRSS